MYSFSFERSVYVFEVKNGVEVERELVWRITGACSPGRAVLKTLPNGDPGHPAEPPEVEFDDAYCARTKEYLDIDLFCDRYGVSKEDLEQDALEEMENQENWGDYQADQDDDEDWGRDEEFWDDDMPIPHEDEEDV